MSILAWVGVISIPVIAFGVIIIAAVVSMRRQLGAIRTIGKTEARPIGEVPEAGLAKIVGVVRHAEEPLTAPLTGRPCAHYEAAIQHYVGGHGAARTGPWETERQQHESRATFLVEDDTGRAIVETDGAWFLLEAMDLQQELSKGEPRSDGMRELRRAQGLDDDANARLGERYLEGIIGELQRVAVYGRCSWEPDPDPGAGADYRSVPRRVRLSAPPGGKVLITTEPRLF